MALTPSNAPDITEGLPAAISAREAAAAYSNRGIRFDVAIGGLPFILAPSDSRQYRRQTAETSKQQLDTSREAGEQTLSQWWTRSQDSWHRGEGIVFYEPASDDGTQYRYGHSVGVDVWTRGEVTLLRKLDRVASVSTGAACFVATGGAGNYYSVEAGVLKRRGAVTTTYTGSGTLIATPPTIAGSKILVGHAAGIDVGDSTGSTLTRLYLNTAGNSLPVRPWWAKSRIIASRGPELFELALAPASPPAALPAALYKHPLSTWQWTAVADSPGAILAAGVSDGHSFVYRFALEDSTGDATPKLGQAYQIAEFPPGESVTSMRVYLGQYVAIGTSRGVRVGIVSNDGSLQYGPLIVETDSPVLDLAARDSYIYAAVTNAIDGESGAVRINLGEEIEDLRYAWAWDVQAHTTGNATSIGFVGNTNQVVLGVDGGGVYVQNPQIYEKSGYVTSGKIRYGTTELKQFLRARVGGRVNDPLSGLSVLFIDNRGSERFIFRLGDQDGDGVDLALSQVSALPNGALRVVLEAGENQAMTPTLDAVLVKALPAVRRQRLIQYPLACFDRERDRYGNATTVLNGAARRLFALEDLESGHATVLVQDFRSGDAYEAQIESISFDSTTPPDKSSTGFGGFLTVTCRRLV